MFGAQLLLCNDQHSVSECSDDTSAPDQALDILMLMPVKHQSRLRSFDVLVERRKTHVHVVLAIVNQARRIMSDENVDPRKAREQLLHLSVFEQIISTRLIFPRTAEAAELHAAIRENSQMQIPHWCRERTARIVIAFDSQDLLAV